MRITGGEWRSRRLTGPSKGMVLRPTPDSLRERGFAILGDLVLGARFLDLFAGTGAVGFEALSRGAETTVFVDSHPAAARLIRSNRASLDIPRERGRLIVAPVRKAVKSLERRRERFTIAWADPPFDRWVEGAEILAEVFRCGLLPAGATACLECPSRAETSMLPELLRVQRDVSGGASRLLLLSSR